MCDLSRRRWPDEGARERGAPSELIVTTTVADVSSEAQVAFRDAVARTPDRSHPPASTMPASAPAVLRRRPRDREKTFAVCWGGVYHGLRLPADVDREPGHIVNTSR
jgi:hypothetical protein